jgi:organic hydroperoxide reductase OsmC/OhrA
MEGREHSLETPPRSGGFGSNANGGELLFLALATCYFTTFSVKGRNKISRCNA